ncbi:hypothetical protein G6F65_020770 [Rhizopus arrhizus]|nr:hypothetical protein G6F65_020770 [Rhizopus arrhizus]
MKNGVPRARRFRIHRGDGSAAGLAAGAAPRFVGLVAGAGAGTRSGAARARATETAAHAALEFLPQLQVALGQLVHHRPRGLPQQVAHLLAELLLLVEEDLHAALQVIAHEALQGIAVEADQLAQQLGGQHRLAVLFLVGDDLQQDRSSEVVAALGVADFELEISVS